MKFFLVNIILKELLIHENPQFSTEDFFQINLKKDKIKFKYFFTWLLKEISYINQAMIHT